MRMYMRWAEANGYKVLLVDQTEGEEAGLKSVTLEITGEYAYGYLKTERGVHRLVRISPFDASSRRHTSFALVEVVPDIESDIEIDINPDDLETDVYKSGGAGGQHVQKNSTAIRIRHLPTGIVVTCQNERSQLRNREMAMRILRGRLYDLELKKQSDEISAQRKSMVRSGDRSDKIRTYNFPQNRVTDHRIGLTLYNLSNIVEGQLNELIEQLKIAERAEKLQATESS